MDEMRYSAAAERKLGELWRDLIESGAGGGLLEFYSCDMPPGGPDETVSEQHLLARLDILPHTLRVQMGYAVRSGDARWGRIVDTDGCGVVDFKLTTDGNGFFNFNTLGFRKGGPVSVSNSLKFFSRRRHDNDD